MKRRKPILEVVSMGGYPFDVLVCVGAQQQQVIDKLHDLGVLLQPEDEEVLLRDWREGRTSMLTGKQVVLQIRDPLKGPNDYALLAHEIFHAVCFVFDAIGISLADESDEAYAYAIQDLTAKIIPLVRR